MDKLLFYILLVFNFLECLILASGFPNLSAVSISQNENEQNSSFENHGARSQTDPEYDNTHSDQNKNLENDWLFEHEGSKSEPSFISDKNNWFKSEPERLSGYKSDLNADFERSDIKDLSNDNISDLDSTSILQMRKRVTRNTQQDRNSLGNMKYFDNLRNLVSDLKDEYDLISLTVYIREDKAVHGIKQLSSQIELTWNVAPCSQASSNLPTISTTRDMNSNSTAKFKVNDYQDDLGVHLYLMLCGMDSTERNLVQMMPYIKDQVILIAGQDIEKDWMPKIYVPIDTMVIIASQATNDTFFLREIWSPAKYLDLKQGHLGSWFNKALESQELDDHNTGKSKRLWMTQQLKSERRRDLTGVHFVVTFVSDSRRRAHFMTTDPLTNRTILSGYFGDVWELLSSELNFTYSIRSPDDGEFGRFHNGSWTGLISDVLEKRADVIVAFLSQTYSRSQVINFSSVLLKFSYRIFARPPSTGSVSWNSYTQPFGTGLWASIGSVFLLIVSFFWFLSHYYYKLASNSLDMKNINESYKVQSRRFLRFRQFRRDSPLLIWAAFTQQGWPLTPDIGSLRIVFWTSYFLSVMLLAAYSATLVSFLTVAGDGLEFDSLEDLKALGNYRLGIQKGSVLEELFKTPKFSVYWNALIANHKDTVELSFKVIRENALNDPKYAYIGSYEIQRLDPVGACALRSARQHLVFNDGAFAWDKNFPYGPVFNHFIYTLRETGVLHKFKNLYYPRPYKCPDTPAIALDFKKVFTAFVLLAFGGMMSVVLMAVEKLYNGSVLKAPQKENEKRNYLDKQISEKMKQLEGKDSPVID